MLWANEPNQFEFSSTARKVDLFAAWWGNECICLYLENLFVYKMET